MRAKNARVVISPNMSIGMNLMFDVVEKLSTKMKDDYDIEILRCIINLKRTPRVALLLNSRDLVKNLCP